MIKADEEQRNSSPRREGILGICSVVFLCGILGRTFEAFLLVLLLVFFFKRCWTKEWGAVSKWKIVVCVPRCRVQ